MRPTRIDCIAGSMSAAIKKEGQEGMKDIQSSEESWQGHGEEHPVEASVEVSGQIGLECSGCGEHLTLLGLEEDWPKEHRAPSAAARAVTRSPSPTASTERPTLLNRFYEAV